ncbi:DUF4129 domain-containing protein [Nocardioides sp. Soil805]|uniref:DUF4129 domain-containing protein n=1 Tax=Nocardioides sp. Soil805 TaxID=1736416 RepID=UPI00070303E5|nr:DUF4129 domain-containing protein [Nocardioides sp. Soil805]KRF30271.1 hypothetical protein ASG94_19865 [Nocardioides sp. Soil805]
MRRPAVVATLAVAATSLLVVLAVWAALIGPQQVFTGDGPEKVPESSVTTEDAPVDTAGTTRDDVEQSDPPTWVRVLLNVVGGAIQLAALAGMVLAVVLVVRRLHTAWALRRVHEEAATGEFEVLDDRRRVADAMAQDVVAQTRILEEGEPRNAIVECWHRFEVQAERAGLGRHPSETSSELALRMLDVADVDRAAVTRLLGLYREARFSPHEVGEDDRRAALDALARIRAGSGAVR